MCGRYEFDSPLCSTEESHRECEKFIYFIKKKSSVEHKGKQSPDETRIFYFIYIKVRTSEVTEALLQIFKSGLLQAPSSLSIKDGEDELYSALSFFFSFFFLLLLLVSVPVLLPAGLTDCHSIGHPFPYLPRGTSGWQALAEVSMTSAV